jgi:hypothetical protein
MENGVQTGNRNSIFVVKLFGDMRLQLTVIFGNGNYFAINQPMSNIIFI